MKLQTESIINVALEMPNSIYQLHICYRGKIKHWSIMPTTDGFNHVAEEVGELVKKSLIEIENG